MAVKLVTSTVRNSLRAVLRKQRQAPRDFDPVARAMWKRVAPYTMTSPERMLALRDATAYVVKSEIPGSFVECGVWRGGSMMAVALTLLELDAATRHLYLFDTFQGMSDPGPEDIDLSGTSAKELMAESDEGSDVWAIGRIEDVRRVMESTGYPRELIHYIRGDVLETVPDRAPAEIALLRLDTDWYASTKHELSHLYPRLRPHGVLVIDDYGHWQGARQAVDEYVAENNLRLLLSRVDYTGRVAVKS